MDAATLTAEMTKALAWPAAAFAIVLVLRKPLSNLLESLRRVKYKEFEDRSALRRARA